MTKENYRINKILNNNIVLAFDLVNKHETIIIGKGVGFGKKEGKKAYISPESIEKSFIADDEKTKQEYFRLIKQVDSNIIRISEEIIDMAEKSLGVLNSHIHILLTDHISFSIERVKEGLEISNPFIDEIKILYPEEFEIAVAGVKSIKEKLNIDLGYGEIGFIAMHIHSARKNVNVKQTVKNARVMNEIVEIIEHSLSIKIDKTDYAYKRLINHIQSAIERIVAKKCIENPLLSNIKEKFKDSFEIINKIKEKIEMEYEIEAPESELGYMALHVERLKEPLKTK